MAGAALPDESDENLSAIRRRVRVDRFNITEPDAVLHYLTKAKPNYLFHLAAISSVGQSFLLGGLTFRVNAIGTYNLFEAARKLKGLRKLLLASSSDVYGPVKAKDMPLKPHQPFNPISPYAQSKVSAEYLARTYQDSYGLPIITVRAFNHSGPRQTAQFVIPSLCRKIVAAEKSGGKAPVAVGNLSAKRDISDVRDIVRGYHLLVEKGKPGEVYHLCSGKTYRISDVLNKLISLTDIHVKIERDAALYRKADIPTLWGDYSRTRRDVGWKPLITIDTTLEDTLNFWRTRG